MMNFGVVEDNLEEVLKFSPTGVMQTTWNDNEFLGIKKLQLMQELC